MSLVRHILFIFLIFATYQNAYSKDDTTTQKVDAVEPTMNPNNTQTINGSYPITSKDVAPAMPVEPVRLNFSRKINSSLTLKISVEKAKCGPGKGNVENKTPKPTELNEAEAATNSRGTQDNDPAESCEYLDESDDYYIKSNIPNITIKVKCDVHKELTCLIPKSKIDASAINSTAITLSNQIWLSQTSFNVESLFNNNNGADHTSTSREQISYLLSKSTAVNQRIRYYYNSTKANENKVGSLKALLWNDHLVGSEITQQMPMNFTVANTGSCFTDNNDYWMCSDIIFETNSTNRLPVTDFYIENVREKSPGTGSPGPENSAPIQKIYFELVELCFSHKRNSP